MAEKSAAELRRLIDKAEKDAYQAWYHGRFAEQAEHEARIAKLKEELGNKEATNANDQV